MNNVWKEKKRKEQMRHTLWISLSWLSCSRPLIGLIFKFIKCSVGERGTTCANYLSTLKSGYHLLVWGLAQWLILCFWDLYPLLFAPPLFTTSACACTQVSMQTRYPVSLQTYTRVIDIIPSVPRNFQRSKKVLEKSELKSESMTVIFPYSPAFVGRWCCLICVATKWRVVDHALRILTHTHIYIDR